MSAQPNGLAMSDLGSHPPSYRTISGSSSIQSRLSFNGSLSRPLTMSTQYNELAMPDSGSHPPSYRTRSGSSSAQSRLSFNGSLSRRPSGFSLRKSSITEPKRVNYIFIKRSGDAPVKGPFLIDPNLDVPETLLYPISSGESRKNMKIELTKAPIDVNIHLTSTSDVTTRPEIHLHSKEGSVSACMSRDDLIPVRFSLEVSSETGAVTISLPKDFYGVLCIDSHHRKVAFSGQLKPHLAQFSEVEECHTRGCQRCAAGSISLLRKYHIGDISDATEMDYVSIQAQAGVVRVQYNDDFSGLMKLFS